MSSEWYSTWQSRKNNGSLIPNFRTCHLCLSYIHVEELFVEASVSVSVGVVFVVVSGC